MGNTPSSTNSHADLYEQYLNEQKRIIAAQQEQINNLTHMNLNNNPVNQPHRIPSNVYLQSMPIQKPQNTYTNDSFQQALPQIDYDKMPQVKSQKEKLNPYKILNISKQFDEKSLKKAYLKKALITHPDRGGSAVEFQQVSIAYTLLLKKLNDMNNNHQHNDLRNNSREYSQNQSQNNLRNVNMTDNFDVNMFNKIYDENKLDDVYDRGYGDWMKKENNNLKQPKMFNKSFNKDLFNHEFDKYKVEQQKKLGSQIIKYEEPQVDISMRGKDSLMVLGQNNVADFSGTSEGGLNFRDYKDAFTNSCLIDTGSMDLNGRENSIQGVERSRSNISYQMSEQDLRSQHLRNSRREQEEQDRIHRLNQQDNRAFTMYDKIHSRLIGS